MKVLFKFVMFVLLFACQYASAKLQTASNIFDSDLSLEKCIAVAKEARLSLTKERFGEIITEEGYFYGFENTHVDVFCITKKNLIVIVAASENEEVLKYINTFSKYFESYGKPMYE